MNRIPALARTAITWLFDSPRTPHRIIKILYGSFVYVLISWALGAHWWDDTY